MKINGLHIKPHLTVDLEENSFLILAVCKRALRQLNITPTEIHRFFKEATSADRKHLIAVVEAVFECKKEP